MGKKNEQAPAEKPKLTPGYNVNAVLNKSAAENHSTMMADDLAGLDDIPSASSKRTSPRPSAQSPTASTPEPAPAPAPTPEPAPVAAPTPEPAPATISTLAPVSLEQPSSVPAIAEQDNSVVVSPAAAPTAGNDLGFDWLWQSTAEKSTIQFRLSETNRDFLLMLAQIAPSPITPTALLGNIVTEFRNRHNEEFQKLLMAYYKNQLKKVR